MIKDFSGLILFTDMKILSDFMERKGKNNYLLKLIEKL